MDGSEPYGCWREADKADDIIAALTRIRIDLELPLSEEIIDATKEIGTSSQLLRDLYDLFRIYRERRPLVVDYLMIILPCFRQTLLDIKYHIGDEEHSFRQIWMMIQNEMTEEAGISLRTRFIMYNNYLVQLVRLLSRPSLYNAGTLESVMSRILRLRDVQSIEGQSTLPIPSVNDLPIPKPDRPHWAEKVFDRKHPRTKLKHLRVSQCFARPTADSALNIPTGSIALFKCHFDGNLLSIIMYLHPDAADQPRILCRWVDHDGVPAYATKGVHELCVKRSGASLQFRRWSAQKQKPKLWVALFFKYWEKMVLFHDTFVALKARCPSTLACDPEELVLGQEKRLFQGRIVDDGFNHVLTVYEDRSCFGLRLQATARDGPLKRTPVWTAFVANDDDIPISKWIRRTDRTTVLLRDLELYVFCEQYKSRNQRVASGEFEVCFTAVEFADKFVALFKTRDLLSG